MRHWAGAWTAWASMPQPRTAMLISVVTCQICFLADLLFMGIVCTDISTCSSTPKSLNDPLGSTGASWLAFLAYLDKLRVEDRPKVIVLECVANLGANRAIKGRTEKGAALVVDALRERGYVGEWRKISATRFCLPQSRPRARGLFIKNTWRVWP